MEQVVDWFARYAEGILAGVGFIAAYYIGRYAGEHTFMATLAREAMHRRAGIWGIDRNGRPFWVVGGQPPDEPIDRYAADLND